MNAKHRDSSQDFNPLRLAHTQMNTTYPQTPPTETMTIAANPPLGHSHHNQRFKMKLQIYLKATLTDTRSHTHTLHTLTEIQCLYTLILWPNISGYAQTNEHHWHKPKPEIKQKVFCVKDVARTTMTTTTTTTASKVSV